MCYSALETSSDVTWFYITWTYYNNLTFILRLKNAMQTKSHTCIGIPYASLWAEKEM